MTEIQLLNLLAAGAIVVLWVGVVGRILDRYRHLL